VGIEQKSEEQIFTVAAQFESRAERDAYVAKACRDDQKLLAGVQALLQHHDANSFLDAPILEPDLILDNSPLTEGPGTIVGRYKLLEKIGEGGMAVVYMAEQEKPIHRKVALKIIKLGMDTRSVIARFEAERQALALMDHPNIAKVLDAGATETGRPYFVMELVTGVSITEYCDKNNLSTKERLSLFIQVCNAVQHAHQKGIIHRDIKPTNVMLTLHDGKPVPKVIDFGIAKAINQKLTEKTLFTRYAHIIGTPVYMSPEQAELNDLDVDTRSDIYSLGVLLYELLTGTTPFSEEELRKVGYIEMERIIREQEPVKPSTKLSTLSKTLTDVAKHHGSTPDLLRKAIRGDLDWIVMKTLEKARERRYDNASALALDIQRHLKDQPILARAPGTFYRLQKFFRRHQIQIVASLVVSVLAVTLLVVLLVWSHKRRLWEAERFLREKTTLSRAIDSLFYRDLDAALADVESILDSKYVGSEARRRRDEILARIRKRVRSYTEKIEANPKDAQNYLLRAQQYYCLRETENMIADMEMYVNILSPLDETNPHDLWFRDFLIGLWQSTPTNLGPTVNSSVEEWGSSLSPDGLSLYLESNRPGGEGKNDIWVSTRATKEDDWGAPVNLGAPINTPAVEQTPCISADGLELYFNDHPVGPRAGSLSTGSLWVARRATVSDPWGEPENLGLTININTSKVGAGPSLSPDGLSLFLASPWPKDPFLNDWDLYVATRPTRDDVWSEPVNLGPTVNGVNSTSLNFCPAISADGLLLVFSSNRPGGSGGQDLWMTRRSTIDGPWSEPVNLGPTINSGKWEVEPEISPDGRSLLFCSGRGGGHGDFDIWQVPIVPVVGNLEQDGDSDSAVESDKSNGGKEG